MAVKADATQVKRRVNKLAKELQPISKRAMRKAALDTVKEVEISAYRRVAVRNDQVGFDFFQFIENIQGVTPDGTGYAILDTDKMGTINDFEEIRGEKLWHQGTRGGDKFRQAVYQNDERRAELAEERKAFWGDKTPQWILIEFGSSTGGEYPPVPAAHFIGKVRDGGTIFRAWRRRVRDELKNAQLGDTFEGID